MAVITRHNLDELSSSRYREGHANIYKFRASIKIMHGDEPIDIEPMNIKSFVIDNIYDDYNMPMIFVTLNISKKHCDILVNNQDSDTVIFKIEKCIINSDTPDMYTTYIEDEFIYFISEDINKDDKVEYDGPNADREDIFNVMTLGLMSRTLLNNNKVDKNGVISGSVSSCIYYITGHFPLLMEPIQHNKSINIFLPPLNSCAKQIRYLNSIQAFYDTTYRYFMDFGVTYLLSSSGKKVQRQGEVITDLLIKLTNSYYACMDGMMIDNKEKVYYAEADGNECYLSDGHAIDKSYTSIQSVTTDGSASKGSSTNNQSSYMKSKMTNIRIPNGNTTLLKNMENELKTGSIQLSVFMQDIDPSVYTINKELTIDSSDVYEDKSYDGRYLMTRRREVYIRENEKFTLGVTLSLRKISQ